MKARNKEHFTSSWKEYANGLKGLFNTAEKLETIKEIRETIKEIHRLIEKVGDEGNPIE